VPIGADVIVVGGGLAGLVATAELADAGRRVIVVEQEPDASLGRARRLRGDRPRQLGAALPHHLGGPAPA
jgi:predicted oxidoreductase